MKTLSVRQPWANLIVHGLKDIENRTWRTNFRGRILIHAPKTIEKKITFYLTEKIFDMACCSDKFQLDILENMTTSAIIGSIEIVDCVKGHYSSWADPDCWHWVLKDPILFDKPILNVKGKLSLWEYKS